MATVVKHRVVKSGIQFIVMREGSTDCEVRFRISRQLYLRVMKFYGKVSNWFKTCEIYRQPSGWYAAYGRNDVVNGAKRIIELIHSAIVRGFKNAPRQTVGVPSTVLSVGTSAGTVFVVKKRKVTGGYLRPIGVCRAIQATISKITSGLSIADLEIRERLKSISRMSEKMQMLQTRFAH